MLVFFLKECLFVEVFVILSLTLDHLCYLNGRVAECVAEDV